MRSILVLSLLLSAAAAHAQSDARQLHAILSRELQHPEVTGFQLRQYAMKRVTPLKLPQNASAWTTEAQRIRKHLLQDIVFHGWPSDWVNAPRAGSIFLR